MESPPVLDSPGRDAIASPVPANYRRGARPTWHQRRRHRCVLSLLGQVEGEVLDCGCGYGDLTYAISKSHPVEGVDADPARIAYAAREYAPLRFRVCEVDRLAYPDKSFDVVTSVVVLHFVPDPVAHLRELRRVLRDDGHLIVVCQNLEYVRNAFRRFLGRGNVPTNRWKRSRSDVIDLLVREGFQPESESYFYDPPFTSWKNVGDLCIGTFEQVLSLLRVRSTCGYFAVLARKV